MGEDSSWFEESLTWKVGYRNKILWWKDRWTGEKTFMYKYP